MGNKFDQAIARRAGILVVMVIIITLIFITALPSIRIEMDFKTFQPESEVVTAYDDMTEYFGRENEYYYILIESTSDPQNVLTPRALREQYNVSMEAMRYDGVLDVYGLAVIADRMAKEYDSDLSLMDASDKTITYIMDYFQAVIVNNSLSESYQDEYEALVGILLSKDFDPTEKPLTAKNTLVIVVLDPELSVADLKQLSVDLHDGLDKLELSDIKLGQTSSHLVTSDIDRIGNQNIMLLGIGIVLLVTFVLAVTFRKISYVILPLATLVIAIIWTFGTMALLGIKFTIIDIAVVPLLLGLGVDYTVHTSRRYISEREKTDSSVKAMRRAQRYIVPAIFLAVLTTSIAFLSNQLSSIQPIREFGLVCAIGIIYAFILTLVFHNACRVLVDRIIADRKTRKDRTPHEDTKVVKMAVKTASQSVRWFPVLAITAAAVISSIAFVGAVNVRTEFNETDFLPDDWDSIKVTHKIRDRFEAGRYSEIYIFIHDELDVARNVATLEMLSQFKQLEDDLYDDEHIVKLNDKPRMESVLNYVQRTLTTNATLSGSYDLNNDAMPDNSNAVVAIFDWMMESDEIADPLTGQTYREKLSTLLHRNDLGDYDAAKITIYVKAETTGEMQELYDELQAELPDFLDTSVIITGNTIMTIVTIDALQTSQVNSTIMAMVLAFILLVILYRSIGLGLISMVPVVLSTLWILGTMYFFGISLNVLTVMVTALTIGLGLDYAIYIVTRYQEERKRHDIREAINATIKGTGSALFISGITTVCGFGILMLSPIPIIAHFGFIIATTIIYCGVLAVVVLPILLGTWERLRDQMKGKKAEALPPKKSDK